MKLREKDFINLNSYYESSKCRENIYSLYKGICQGCGKEIAPGQQFDVAHIIPQSKPEMFMEYFPSLDVDNLLNLRLSCTNCNRKVSDTIIEGPLLLNTFNYSARIINNRLHKIKDKKINYPDIDYIINNISNKAKFRILTNDENNCLRLMSLLIWIENKLACKKSNYGKYLTIKYNSGEFSLEPLNDFLTWTCNFETTEYVSVHLNDDDPYTDHYRNFEKRDIYKIINTRREISDYYIVYKKDINKIKRKIIKILLNYENSLRNNLNKTCLDYEPEEIFSPGQEYSV